MSDLPGKRIFYGWYIVAATCVVIAMTVGIINNSFGQFVKPVCADMGFTRQQMSLNQTILSVVSMGFGLSWGRLSRRINLNNWMRLSAVLLPAIFFCYSFANSLLMYYAITLLLGFANCSVSLMIFTYIVGMWFSEKRGIAIGLASMGTGIGAVVMNMVISQLILSIGWRATYRVVGVMMMVVIVPLVWFVIREKPSDMGLLPYGYVEEDDIEQGKPSQSFSNGSSAEDIMRMPVFWALAFCSVGIVMCISILSPTLSPHLNDNGYSVTFAAMMASISMGALAVGKLILGKLFDRLGVRKAAVIACSCTFIGLIGMIFCRHTIALAAIVLGIGLGCSFGAVCMPIITQTLFGMKSFNSIYGKLSAATSLGGAIAPVISGQTFDSFGSYVPIYIVAAGVALIVIITLFMMLPKEDKILVAASKV